jgi:hypothetical protein
VPCSAEGEAAHRPLGSMRRRPPSTIQVRARPLLSTRVADPALFLTYGRRISQQERTWLIIRARAGTGGLGWISHLPAPFATHLLAGGRMCFGIVHPGVAQPLLGGLTRIYTLVTAFPPRHGTTAHARPAGHSRSAHRAPRVPTDSASRSPAAARRHRVRRNKPNHYASGAVLRSSTVTNYYPVAAGGAGDAGQGLYPGYRPPTPGAGQWRCNGRSVPFGRIIPNRQGRL